MKDRLMELYHEAKGLEDTAIILSKGRKVRIISKYNGQPFGSSKKPLTGQVFTIKSVMFDFAGPMLFVEGQNLSLGLSEVEFVD